MELSWRSNDCDARVSDGQNGASPLSLVSETKEVKSNDRGGDDDEHHDRLGLSGSYHVVVKARPRWGFTVVPLGESAIMEGRARNPLNDSLYKLLNFYISIEQLTKSHAYKIK